MKEIYPEDTLVRVTPTRRSVDTTTGEIKIAPLTGRVDGTVYLSRTATGATIAAGVSLTLTETSGGGVYYATFDGSDLWAALGALPDGTVLYQHVVFGTHEVHPVERVVWHTAHLV